MIIIISTLPLAQVAHCAELDISLTGLVLAATVTATAAVTNTATLRVMVHTNLRSEENMIEAGIRALCMCRLYSTDDNV